MSASDNDVDLSSAIDDLVARGTFGRGSPAFDIAQRVIATGYGSLTRKQRELYDAVVIHRSPRSRWGGSERPAAVSAPRCARQIVTAL
jgi:hypothetical protein